ncbi:CYCP3-1 [Linum grandiflorum]
MGTLSTDTGECVEDSNVYLALGLKEVGKGSASKSPRVLALVSSLLERLVQTNELLVETNEIKDVATVFHGLRAPAQTNVHLTSLNVHRLLITSIMLAAKFVDDAFFNNAYYARVGGISTGELNKLEMKFLFSIDFRLQVNTSTFGRYCSYLEREAATDGLHQIERSIQGCRIKETWSNNEESSTCAAMTVLP